MFYNPAMAGDRDIAVAFARAWSSAGSGHGSGWEVTAATGVRGLRLLNESGAFDRFRLTEANAEAAAALVQNCGRYPGAVGECRDGRTPISGLEYDYVDVDPYGTPVPFVPAAMTAVRLGGVLAVTATDMMVLAGVQKGACERRYGARPIRGRLSPEGALRILLAYLAREARARRRAVHPLLCYSRDHYVRAYVRILPATDGPSVDPIESVDPGTWTGPPVGDRGPYGPLWLGRLFDADLTRNLTVPVTPARPGETLRFLERIREESGADHPFYYESNVLAGALGLRSPPALPNLLQALRERGFHAARTHARPEGIRTDAPRRVVEEIAGATSRVR